MVDNHLREGVQKEVDHKNLFVIVTADKIIIKDLVIIIYNKEIRSFI